MRGLPHLNQRTEGTKIRVHPQLGADAGAVWLRVLATQKAHRAAAPENVPKVLSENIKAK